jgi:hypothetical protein
MKFFKKIKKLSHKHLLEIAVSCAAAMLLIFAAVFVGSGGMSRINHLLALDQIIPGSQIASIFPCSWFGDCQQFGVYSLGFTPVSQTIAPGGSATLYWVGYDTGTGGTAGDCFQPAGRSSIEVCNINAGAPDTTYTTGIVMAGTGALGTGLDATPYVVSPANTTTYYFCSKLSTNNGYPCLASTVYVASDNCPATPNPVANGLQVPPGTYQGMSRSMLKLEGRRCSP